MRDGSITDVPGIRVGHSTDLEAMTGCTVVLCPPGTIGSAEVRGGAPSTIGTDSIRPSGLVSEIHAVVLTGGSAFGLASVFGVQRWLEERGVGFDTGPARVPIVPGAVLFDLGIGDPSSRPGPDEGYAACEAASGGPVEEGNVGAGTGATVAKFPDPRMGLKGGLGSSSTFEGDVVVGAIAAVNSLGSIVDADGSLIARNRAEPGAAPDLWPPSNTTLVAVATNARLSKEATFRLAAAAHEGISVAVHPAHTLWDGDVAFALATGEVEGRAGWLDRMASEAVAEAIRRGVRKATALGGYPAALD
jgi:L-aminopeptidase/D-esterase-like protein